MVNLQRFCAVPGIDVREYLHRPWRDGKWSYATNGHVMVRTRDFDATVGDKTDKHPPMAVSMFDDFRAKHGDVPMTALADLPPVDNCPTCNGKAKFNAIKCPSCNGGTFDHFGHTYDCLYCEDSPVEPGFVVSDGLDAKAMPCQCCLGRGFKMTQHVLNGTGFDLGYLHWIAALPGPIQFAIYPGINANNAGAFFTFDGGEAILMERRA